MFLKCFTKKSFRTKQRESGKNRNISKWFRKPFEKNETFLKRFLLSLLGPYAFDLHTYTIEMSVLMIHNVFTSLETCFGSVSQTLISHNLWLISCVLKWGDCFAPLSSTGWVPQVYVHRTWCEALSSGRQVSEIRRFSSSRAGYPFHQYSNGQIPNE